MLTPQEISGKEFVKAVFGGYDMSTVDDFLEQITEDYSALYKENAILKSKIKVLVEKVEEYRATEDAMRMALFTAQKMGDDLISEAKQKSESMLTETDEEAKNKKLQLQQSMKDEEERLNAAKEETVTFVKAAKDICDKYLSFLTKLDEISAESVEQPAPQQEEPQVDEVEDTVRQIDDVMSKLSDESDGTYGETDDGEPHEDMDNTKIFTHAKWAGEEDDEPTSPRPKFNFDDLKFGSNYSGEE